MRTLILGLAMASTVLAAPAVARQGSYYIEVGAGAVKPEDTKVSVPGFKNIAKIDHKTGYDIAGLVGYDFGPIRLETELSYREFKNKRAKTNFGPNLTAPGVVPVGGNLNTLSGMVNVLGDFGRDDGIQAFIGGGAGMATVGGRLTSGGVTFVSDRDLTFAWQGLAGVRIPVSDQVDFGLRYRYFNAPSVKFNALGGTRTKLDVRTHSLLATLSFNLGHAAPLPPPPPPPAPPPPPPPPPPPAQVSCNTGPYIVFFDWDRSDITAEAATVLDNAVTAYGNCNNVPVMVAGHADRSGAARYNVGLSQRRAESVRGYLTSRGISDGAISTQAFGETQNRVPTADGVREPQNRRVEISYGPGSGN